MATKRGDKRLGARIRSLRVTQGLSLEEAAFHANLSAKYWGEIESGAKPLTDSALVKIARVLGLPLPSFADKIA